MRSNAPTKQHIRVPGVLAVAVPASVVSVLSDLLSPFPVLYASTFEYGLFLLAESRPHVALLDVTQEQFVQFDQLARDLRCTPVLFRAGQSNEEIAKSLERELLAQDALRG